MTKNTGRKNDIRTFQAINGINYTTALREFDPSTGLPLFEDDTVALDGREQREEAWASARNLTPAGHSGCFHMLASNSGYVGREHRHQSRPDCVFFHHTAMKDHARAYNHRAEGKRSRLAVVTFAPYRPWDDEQLLDEVRSVADEHDLRFRVGFHADYTYGLSAVPVVIWNPRVIALT